MPAVFRHHQVLWRGALATLGIGLGVVLGVGTPPHAEANDVLTPRIAALAGAGRAAPMLTDAVFQNPSYFSVVQTYCVSGALDLYSPTGTGPHGRQYTLSLLDGRTELVQAGISYSVKEDGRLLSVGLSKAPSESVSVGASSKIVLPADPGLGPVADTTLAMTFRPQGWYQGALIVDNVIETDGIRNQGLHRTVILASKINLEGILTLFVDPSWRPGLSDGTSWGLEVGSELSVMSDLFLRFGFFRNAQIPYLNSRGNGYAVGLGWTAPRISFDYGFHRTTDSALGAPSSFAHVFGTSVFF